MHAYILWIATTAYALHIAEEYTFDWRGWTASISKLQVDWTHFAIGNAVVMVFGVSCAAVGWSAPAYALSLPALMLINATFFHVLPFLVMSKGRFSPGLGAAVLLSSTFHLRVTHGFGGGRSAYSG